MAAQVGPQTLLASACILGSRALLDRLLATAPCVKTAVNTHCPVLGRPLTLAASWGHLDIVKYLVLGCGADMVGLCACCGDSLLYAYDTQWISSRNGFHVTRWICYDKDPCNSTLRASILAGHHEITDFILKFGHGIPLNSKEYFHCIISCAKHSQFTLMQLLLDEAGISSVFNVYGLAEGIFLAAVHSGQQTMASIMIHLGVDINCEIEYSVAGALCIASRQGSHSMLLFLLRLGAATRSYSWSPAIKLAASVGYLANIELLLDNGACPAQALYSAAGWGNWGLVAILLESHHTLVIRNKLREKDISVDDLISGLQSKDKLVCRSLQECYIGNAGPPFPKLTFTGEIPYLKEYQVRPLPPTALTMVQAFNKIGL